MTTAPNVTDAMRQAARGKIRHTPECRPTAADYVKTRGGKGDLLDAWSRYLPAKPDESVTSVTTVTDQDAATITPTAPVTGVTDVTAESPNARVLDLIPDELLDDDGNCRLHHDDPAAPEDCYTCSILLARPW